MDSPWIRSATEMARNAKQIMAASIPARREHLASLCTRCIGKPVGPRSRFSMNLADLMSSTFCYTVRELNLLMLINELNDMPDWDRKIFDPDFTFEWKDSQLMSGKDVTRSMADWVRQHNAYHSIDC